MKKLFSSDNADKYSSNSVATVQEVLNINLIKLTNGKTVKLIGVVPSQNSHEDTMPFPKYLLLGRKVMLDFDSSRTDNEDNLLAYLSVNTEKDFKLIEQNGIVKKYEKSLFFFEAADEESENPEGLIETDTSGNQRINPEIAENMKPKGDLYLQINLALISCGLADFKSMPPNTRMDDLFKNKYKEAIEKKLGIWS
jgi:hypothetical protein